MACASSQRSRHVHLESHGTQCGVACRRTPDLIEAVGAQRVVEQFAVHRASLVGCGSKPQELTLWCQERIGPPFGIASIARPSVVARMRDHPGAHRIELDVSKAT